MDQPLNPRITKSLTLDTSLTFPGPELLVHKIGILIFMCRPIVMTQNEACQSPSTDQYMTTIFLDIR